MRADFHSVVTDGNALRYPDAAMRPVPILDDHDEPRPIGRTREFRKGWREGRNFRHSLVRRYLRSRVGRPFDAVRSDVCHALRGSTLRDALVLHEIDRLVARPRGVDGNGRIQPPTPGPFHHWAPDFFVDADGILRADARTRPGRSYGTRRKLRLLTAPDVLPIVDPDSDAEAQAILERVSDVWYLRRWSRVPSLGARVGSHMSRYGRTTTWFEDVPVLRRQLPSPEIRRLDLAGWSRDAEVLAASIAGRTHDVEAHDRQVARRGAAIARTASNRLG